MTHPSIQGPEERETAFKGFLEDQGLAPSDDDVRELLDAYDRVQTTPGSPDDFSQIKPCAVCGGIRIGSRFQHRPGCAGAHDWGEHCV